MLLALALKPGTVKAKIEAEDKGEYEYNKERNEEILIVEAVIALKVFNSGVLLPYRLGQVFYRTLYIIFDGDNSLMLASYEFIHIGEEI